MLFSSEEKQRRRLASSLTPVAMEYRSRVNFATVDVQRLGFLLEPMGLSADRLPALVVQTGDNLLHFDADSDITADSVGKFVQRVVEIRDAPEREL